ncbi:MAG: DMT family transporter [Actinomycetota bacterium]|nr:DMT family transporter [Actinomycetota bacterium]
MLAIALGLGSALCWGLADFGGGVQSRRLPVFTVLLVSQLVGLAGIAAIVLLSGRPVPSLPALWPATAGGAGGLLALGAFYRALSLGTMSIVAPISATGAAVPVIVGLAGGEKPGTLQVAGIAAAAVGVVLASRDARDVDAARAHAGRASIALALVAALGFGGFFVGVDRAAEADILWALLAARAADGILLAAFVAAVRPRLGLKRGAVGPLIAIGALDLCANALYAWGSTEGLLSLVSVLAALYPVTTVLLARLVLEERIRRVQAVGVLAALIGVVLMAGG